MFPVIPQRKTRAKMRFSREKKTERERDRERVKEMKGKTKTHDRPTRVQKEIRRKHFKRSLCNV